MHTEEARDGCRVVRRCARLIVIAAAAVASSAALALTQIDFISDGDYVGAGLTFSLTPADGTITTTGSVAGVGIQFFGTPFVSPKTFWSLQFSPVAGASLVPGRYPSAQRWPFQSPKRPGLSVFGDGRGCNTLTGFFTVFEAVFDGAGSIVSFAADADQHCEGTGPALHVRVRINSSVPLLVPFPQAMAGLPQETYERTLVTLDGSQSYESGGVIVSWQWSQLSGPAVVIEAPTSAVTLFRAPEVAPGGADLRFKLDVADGSGIHATDTIDVHVFDRHDRRTWLTWRSPPGDYIGQGQPLAFSLADGAAAFVGTVSTAEIHFQGDTFNNWYTNFAAADAAPLVPGTYLGAERYPFRSAGHPGLEIFGSGRGCNTLSGQFTIIEFDRVSTPPHFAARFVQSCEGFMPALRGTALFNGIAPGNPVARIAGPAFASPGSPVTLDGAGSSSSGSTLVSYRWRQLSGPAVATSDPSLPRLDFVAPAAAVRFELEVTDEDGLVDAAEFAAAGAPATTPVPALDARMLAALILAVAVIGTALTRRRRAPGP